MEQTALDGDRSWPKLNTLMQRGKPYYASEEFGAGRLLPVNSEDGRGRKGDGMEKGHRLAGQEGNREILQCMYFRRLANASATKASRQISGSW